MLQTMRRATRLLAIAALLAALLFVLWTSGGFSPNGSASANLSGSIRTAATNPVQFVKRKISGGVGVLLRTGPLGQIIVDATVPGSPAQKAGLRGGDVILQVDDAAVAGKPLADVVDSIRGLIGGEVTLKVGRGDTNLSIIIHRDSWEKLKVIPP
jgi:S1-C subfamily serine protease